jgi:conjugal transfer pilin signal peptidase TrbI
MKNVKLLLTGLIFLSIYLLVNTFVQPVVGIRINNSVSLPYKLFVSLPLAKLKRGSYVSFETPVSPLPLVKEIKGLPGDAIQIRDEHVYVNEEDCGIPMKISKSGKVYRPIAETFIPEGYVYLFAPHAESYDSRYTEFGLIPIDDLKEELWPIF